ncbi:MAG: class I SAM-dependent methyltransferase [Nitriliruptorales bacterium]|nr:class I SAM-dependent methyltransferase [Nitriliruptorales bacterium]
MSPDSPPPLALTGERTLPGVNDENYWFQRHVVAYELAAARAGHRAVLDAGCGEGYGLEMLASGGAVRVVGADLDEQVIAHVGATYARHDPRIEAVSCELMELPLDDESIDLVVSFQVIEHLYDIPGYLASLRRVTRPGGELMISTPNRLTFTPGSETPVNPFHVREFAPDELVEEIERAGFRVTLLIGLRHARWLRSLERLGGRTLPDLLSSRPPAHWPAWVRWVVAGVRPSWFELHPRDLEDTLDLIVVARKPLEDG